MVPGSVMPDLSENHNVAASTADIIIPNIAPLPNVCLYHAFRAPLTLVVTGERTSAIHLG